MYIGPWQEYRLARALAEHRKLLHAGASIASARTAGSVLAQKVFGGHLRFPGHGCEIGEVMKVLKFLIISFEKMRTEPLWSTANFSKPRRAQRPQECSRLP